MSKTLVLNSLEHILTYIYMLLVTGGLASINFLSLVSGYDLIGFASVLIQVIRAKCNCIWTIHSGQCFAWS